MHTGMLTVLWFLLSFFPQSPAAAPASQLPAEVTVSGTEATEWLLASLRIQVAEMQLTQARRDLQEFEGRLQAMRSEFVKLTFQATKIPQADLGKYQVTTDEKTVRFIRKKEP